MLDMNEKHRGCRSIDVKPRNYIYNANCIKTAQSKVIANCFTPNGTYMASVDSLDDPVTCIRIRNLKFWKRNDDKEYDIYQMVNLYDFDQDNVFVCAVSNEAIAVSQGPRVQVWMYKSEQWNMAYELNNKNLNVRQLIPNQRLRVPDISKAAQLVVLYEDGVLAFWNQNTWSLSYTLMTQRQLTKVVFEASSRYFAGITDEGSVSVWGMKQGNPYEEWTLNFRSVSMLQASKTENQFLIGMNSQDEHGKDVDSILLFQFSRAQNLIFHWTFKVPLTAITSFSSSNRLVVINKFGEF